MSGRQIDGSLAESTVRVNTEKNRKEPKRTDNTGAGNKILLASCFLLLPCTLHLLSFTYSVTQPKAQAVYLDRTPVPVVARVLNELKVGADCHK